MAHRAERPKPGKTRREETGGNFIRLARAITRVLGFKPAAEIARRQYASLPAAAHGQSVVNALWYGNAAGHDFGDSFGHDSRPPNCPSATP